MTAVPIVLLVAWAISGILDTLKDKLPRGPRRQHPSLKRVALIGLLGIVITASLFQTSVNVQILSDSGGENTSVVAADIEAFQWINENLDSDAVIWVNRADAGEWILVYTGRKVFPFRMLVDIPEIVDDWNELDRLMQEDPTQLRALQLLQAYGVTHIYLGAKETALWLNRTQPSLSQFLQVPWIYRVVYEESGAYLFEIAWDEKASPKSSVSMEVERNLLITLDLEEQVQERIFASRCACRLRALKFHG